MNISRPVPSSLDCQAKSQDALLEECLALEEISEGADYRQAKVSDLTSQYLCHTKHILRYTLEYIIKA